MSRTVICTANAPSAIGPYSQAIAAKDLLFISGQLPIDPSTGKMIEGDIGGKIQQIMKNITAIAQEAGTDLTKALKTTIFLTDLADFQAVNSAYGSYFPKAPPARSTVQVAALPLGSNIEIDCILAI